MFDDLTGQSIRRISSFPKLIDQMTSLCLAYCHKLTATVKGEHRTPRPHFYTLQQSQYLFQRHGSLFSSYSPMQKRPADCLSRSEKSTIMIAEA
ncbi:hypothetical protein TNCV_1992741 [Trichonephila clavipes]|nr:hypothetical protein TNCV_1992741 [Trichonephila clavipes]